MSREVLSVRLLPDEKQKLYAIAESCNVPVSTVVSLAIAGLIQGWTSGQQLSEVTRDG